MKIQAGGAPGEDFGEDFGEGGEDGGEIIAEGPPEYISMKKESYTGSFLKSILKIRG